MFNNFYLLNRFYKYTSLAHCKNYFRAEFFVRYFFKTRIFRTDTNYILNHLWTFKGENKNAPRNVRYYLYYIAGNIVCLCVNLVFLNVLIIMWGNRYSILAQCCGVLSGVAFNYMFAKKIVFLKQVSTSVEI